MHAQTTEGSAERLAQAQHTYVLAHLTSLTTTGAALAPMLNSSMY